MKFLSRFFIAAVCFFSASSNLFAQFVMDIPQKEFREKVGQFIVADLSVGQTAWVMISPSFCSIGEKIFINKYMRTAGNKGDYFASAKIFMEPDNNISVTFYATKDPKENMVDYLGANFMGITAPCPTIVYGNDAFFPIKSINGATTITDLMKKELN